MFISVCHFYRFIFFIKLSLFTLVLLEFKVMVNGNKMCCFD